jgi:hypothetical protein
MRTVTRWTHALLLAAALAAPAAADDADAPCVAGRLAPPGGLSRIALEAVGFPRALRDVPRLAAEMWNAGPCNAGRFPRFTFDGDGDRLLRVRWIDGVSPTPGVCGRFARDEIELYAATLTPLRSEPLRCGDRLRIAETLAHELGHALGLLDVRGPACAGRIMDQLRLRADGTLAPRAVHAEECAVADRRFHTLAERSAPSRPQTWSGELTSISRLESRTDRLPSGGPLLPRPPAE